eukprot:scaffold15813_cov117-Isochrysis_galbana.AAC.1
MPIHRHTHVHSCTGSSPNRRGTAAMPIHRYTHVHSCTGSSPNRRGTAAMPIHRHTHVHSSGVNGRGIQGPSPAHPHTPVHTCAGSGVNGRGIQGPSPAHPHTRPRSQLTWPPAPAYSHRCPHLLFTGELGHHGGCGGARLHPQAVDSISGPEAREPPHRRADGVKGDWCERGEGVKGDWCERGDGVKGDWCERGEGVKGDWYERGGVSERGGDVNGERV